MFDWKDEELTNIISDKDGESDDHIVTYPDQIEEKPPILVGDRSKKETKQETANVSEQKKLTIKPDHGVELDTSSKYDSGDPATGFPLDSWPDELDSSLSDAANADWESMGTAASNNLTKNPKNGSLRDETFQFNKDSEIFQNPSEDREQGDFVDYGWANIGSFDDLDRIFSNNNPIFGDISVGNADELWSPSKDVVCSPLAPTSLCADRSENEAHHVLGPSQSFISGYEQLNEITSHASEDVQASIDTIEQSGGKSKLLMKEKRFEMSGKIQACHMQLDDETAAPLNEFPESNTQKRLLKGQKSDKKSKVRQMHDLRGTWSSSGSPFQQANSQYAPLMVSPRPPLVCTQQRQLHGPGSLPQNHFSCPLLTSPTYGNLVNHYPAFSNQEPMPSGYEVPPGDANSLRSVDNAIKPPDMTPKEKIEKLRRRQQLRAILAIQKQKQQLGNQVAVAEQTTAPGGNIEADENLSSFPSLDPNSPIEQDDSNAVSMVADNCSMEESVIYLLQAVIAKLDIQIRLCIRDSLFRLAQSAIQRQYPSNTSSTNASSRDEVLGSKDIDNRERFTRVPDVETDTNPIDRTVAHLLFHRPLKSSGKPSEMPDSPVFANLPYKSRPNSLKRIAKGFPPDAFEYTQMTSPEGSRTTALVSEVDQSENSPRLYTSQNASKSKAAEGGQTKVEASKSLSSQLL